MAPHVRLSVSRIVVGLSVINSASHAPIGAHVDIKRYICLPFKVLSDLINLSVILQST